MSKKVGLEYTPNFIGGDPFWFIDTCHTEIGFEIIYRPEEIRANDRVIEKLKKAFMKQFGLPSNRYRFDPTFWRIYWDRGDFLSLSLLKQCEKAMDEVATKNGILVKQNGTAIQIRPLNYLQEQIENNAE